MFVMFCSQFPSSLSGGIGGWHNVLTSRRLGPCVVVFLCPMVCLPNTGLNSPFSPLSPLSPSHRHRGGVRPRGLPVRGAEASVRLGAGEAVFHGGLQGGQEEPGPGVPLRGRGSVLGARAPRPKGVRGQHDPERKTGPISCPISSTGEQI